MSKTVVSSRERRSSTSACADAMTEAFDSGREICGDDIVPAEKAYEAFDALIKQEYSVALGTFNARGVLNPAALTIACIIEPAAYSGAPEENLWMIRFAGFGVLTAR